MPDQRPNVLIVILDSARPAWLSCYDPSGAASPAIDAVAEKGLVFTQAIGPSAWTFPCMASVFTGMLPSKHGGHDEHQLLDSRHPTMAEVFERHGYDTAAFADVPYVGPSTRLDRGFRAMSHQRASEVRPVNKIRKGLGRLRRALTGRYDKTFETSILIGETLHWLQRRRDRRKPFFLYVHSDETHAPFLPPAKYRRRFANLTRRRMFDINQDKQLYVGGAVEMTTRDFEELNRLARAEVTFFDAALKKVFDLLRCEGLLDDTIIVVAADHGDNIGEHGLLRHGLCLYDTLLHVPLILKPPGDGGGKRIDRMVQLIDLFPTLMGLADIREPETSEEFQGIDLMRAIAEDRFQPYAVSELYRPSSQAMWKKKVPNFMPTFLERHDRRLRSYRTETHKFIWSSDGRHELYDLVNDPGEERDIVNREPARAARMERQLELWLASFSHDENQRVDSYAVEDVADEKVYERLRDLGYVE